MVLKLQFPDLDLTEFVKESIGDKGVDGLLGVEKIKKHSKEFNYTHNTNDVKLPKSSENFLNRHQPVLSQVIHVLNYLTLRMFSMILICLSFHG